MSREELIKKELEKTIGYVKYNNWSNRRTNYGYHSFNIDEINILGQRNPKKRLNLYKDYVTFTNKNVVDFGSNVGGMLFHIPEIKQGVGFDFDINCINAAKNIKKILGYENLNFYVFDFDKNDFNELKKFILYKPDVIFILSLGAWIKNNEGLFQFCIELGGVLILEVNSVKIGKSQVEFFENRGFNTKLIIDNSDDDIISMNKKSRRTYLIDLDGR